ncbi:Endopolygalacturonase [Durusdinium trenchii]|uniref:Endopolygalacturonase n=1 Tax=Durusdinium trenchii TaxID=1381693 RepID=A0ABP0QY32_9DINO
MGIRYFDVALLVTSSRFTEAELMLSRELEKFQVPYFMVRNKARFVPRRVARATRTAFRDTVVDRGRRVLDICGHRVGPKVDVDIDSEIVKEEEAHDDEELSKQQKLEVATQTIECIKDYFQIEYGLDQVYCVSARRKLRKAHDFPSLERDILDAVRVQRGY